jgi:hypothetical protein
LTKDTSGVDFVLSALPKAIAKLSGMVTDSAGAGLPAKLVLHSLRRGMVSAKPEPETRSIHSDSLGSFTFTNVPNGKYFLQAIPFKGYLPAFYHTGSNLRDTITVTGADISGLNISVKKVTANGAGMITGRVHLPDGQSVAGAVVMAASQDGSSTNFAISGADGNFAIDAMDPNTYTVAVDKLGYVAAGTTTAVIDYQNQTFTAQVGLELSVQSPTAVEPQSAGVINSFKLDQNYPNPFNPSTMIAFEIPSASHVSIVVYDYLGRTVRTLIDENRASGHYSVQFDASTLASGMYLYRLSAGSYSAVKTMLLIK